MRPLLLITLSVLLSCRSPSSSVAPTPSESPTVPLSLSWSPRRESEGNSQLELIIEKRIATEKNLDVELRLPDGVRVEPSSARWSIAAATTGTLKYELSVSWSGAAPATDLVAVADMQGTSSGFHAEVPYRFGRAAPVDAPLKQTAQPVQIGNTNLGHPVDMTK